MKHFVTFFSNARIHVLFFFFFSVFVLREEMDSLQRQMEEHTVTVHESVSSWTNAELGLQNNKSSTPLNNMVVENNNEAEEQES